MDPTLLTDVVAPIVVAVIAIPYAFQFAHNMSNKIHATELQRQINDNTAINNTTLEGTAGTKEVAKEAKDG